jgi:hypothetical protein
MISGWQSGSNGKTPAYQAWSPELLKRKKLIPRPIKRRNNTDQRRDKWKRGYKDNRKDQ